MTSRRLTKWYVSVFPSASSISFLIQVINTTPAKVPEAVPGDNEPEDDEEVFPPYLIFYVSHFILDLRQ
jgi:hypothetical protein